MTTPTTQSSAPTPHLGRSPDVDPPPLEPAGVAISNPAAAVYGALHGLDRPTAVGAIRRRLYKHEGELSPCLQEGVRMQPLRRYPCGEVSFLVSENNQTVVRVEVDDRAALDAGFGLRLDPRLVSISPDLILSFAKHESLDPTEAEEELRLLLEVAASGPVPPIAESEGRHSRRYYVGAATLLVTPAHYQLKAIFTPDPEDHEWADNNPIPLDVDTVAATNKALEKFASLLGREVNLADRVERRGVLEELRTALEGCNGQLAPARTSAGQRRPLRYYLSAGYVFVLWGSNRCVATVFRAPTLDAGTFGIARAAMEDLARLLPHLGRTAALDLRAALTSRDGHTPHSARSLGDGELYQVYEVELAGTQLDVYFVGSLYTAARIGLRGQLPLTSSPVPQQRPSPPTLSPPPPFSPAPTQRFAGIIETSEGLLSSDKDVRDFFEQQRDSLLSRREAIVEQLKGFEGRPLKEEEHHTQQSLTAAQHSIDAALAAMASDRYGSCSECNHAIAFDRLLAVPHATRCLACAPRPRP